MAEGIMNHKISKYGIEDFVSVDSCGFERSHVGDSPDSRALSTMQKHGIDISFYKQRLFRKTDFVEFDKIYVMDTGNYSNVKAIAKSPEDMQKVDYLLNEVHGEGNKIVPDPYYDGMSAFEEVYNILDEACEVIITKYQFRELKRKKRRRK